MSDLGNISDSQLKRIIAFHELIKNKKYPNCSEMARLLNCAVMTARKDKDILEFQFHAPLKYSEKNKGYYYLKDFELPLVTDINEDEVKLIFLLKTLLNQYKEGTFPEEAEEFISKFVNANISNQTHSLINRISVAPQPKITIDSHLWNIIGSAMIESKKVEFYSDGNHNPELRKRTVHPYQILLENGKSLLFGYLEEKKECRLFKLSKIKDLKILDESFELPEVYEFEKMFPGSKLGAFTRYEPKKYKIAFYEDAREDVRDVVWAEDQVIEEDDENDRTIISFTSTQDVRVLDWVFENKAYAWPLEPPELVIRWKYNVKVMAEMAGLLKPDGKYYEDMWEDYLLEQKEKNK